MELGDKLANLRVIEAVQLKDYLKEKYNIEPAGGGVVMAAPTTTAAVAEKPAEETEFRSSWKAWPTPPRRSASSRWSANSPTSASRRPRTWWKGRPSRSRRPSPKDEANAIKKKLEDAGGKVSLKPA